MNSQVILVLIFSSVLSCRGGYKIACVFSSMCDTHGHKTPKQSPHYKIKWLLMMALPPLCFVEVHRPCQASPSGMISATDTSPIIEAIFPSTGDTDEVDRLTPVAVFIFYSVVINTIFYMYFLYFSLTWTAAALSFSFFVSVHALPENMLNKQFYLVLLHWSGPPTLMLVAMRPI